MKKKLLIVTVLFGMLVLHANCQTPVPGGAVSGEWNLAGSPYQIQGSIIIENDSVLTVHPGVVVNFDGACFLQVNGRLNATGTMHDSIFFTTSDTTKGWQGIRFDNTATSNDTSRISFCRFEYGKASGAQPFNLGGALYFKNFSKTVISNSLLINCSAVSGGAICCIRSSPVITSNIISKNSAQTGAGIYCIDGSNPLISKNTITHNTSESGSGIYIHDINSSSSPTIIYNTISFNGRSSRSDGGGIHCVGGASIISHNLISDNLASQGGGIFSGSSATISENIISNNLCTSAGYEYEGGGGIYSVGVSLIFNNVITNNTSDIDGGGLYCNYDASEIYNNVIVNNTAQHGGAIFHTSAYYHNRTSFFYNNTIANNSAVSGGAVFFDTPADYSRGSFLNTIIWGNCADSGSQVYINDSKCRPDFSYCDVQGGYEAFVLNPNASFLGWYSHNIDSDPLFVSPSGGCGTMFNGLTADWSLKKSSPCIDTGYSNGSYPLTDILGHPRVVGRDIDQGAFEYQGPDGILVYKAQNHITIAPNPCSVSTIIHSDIIFHNATLSLYNAQGKEVKQLINMNGQQIILQRDNLPGGIYFVRLTNEDRTLYNARLIIEND